MQSFTKRAYNYFLIKRNKLINIVLLKLNRVFKSFQFYYSVYILREVSIVITSEHGLGSKLNWMLEFLYFAEKQNIKVNIEIGHKHCKQNLCSEIFKFKEEYKSQTKFRIAIYRMDLIWGFSQINNNLNLKITRLLIEKYFDPIIFSTPISNISESLVLHLRGTDKINESFQFTDEELLCQINDFISITKPKEIIVFTDDYRLQELARKNLKSFALRFPNEIDVNKPILHHTEILNCSEFYSVNLKALEDMLTMSKARYILKTSSYLSDWSIILGDHHRIRLINKQLPEYNYFPSSEIAKIST